MKHQIFSTELVEEAARKMKVANLQEATIGDVLLVASYLENETGIPFIRMDQGSPGLPANRIGVEAEKAALDRGVGATYPAAAGVQELKEAASRFVKAFINTDISPRACIPTTGSVASSFASFIACTQRDPQKDTVLFIDPGFPIQKSQLRILGVKWEQFDIYAHRGEGLRQKLESYLEKGNIAAIIYSNPNNPAWICLEESELQVIGELATRYDAVVLEDLAYFCMDFRRNMGRPYEPPYPPTVVALYRQLHHHALGLEDFQLCRSTHRTGLHLRPPVRPPVPGAGRAICRLGHLRPHLHRINSLHDNIGLHGIDPIWLCRDAQPLGRRHHRLRSRCLGLRRESRQDEKDIYRQRLPHRLRPRRYAARGRRLLLHHRLRTHDQWRTHARTALLRCEQHLPVDHRQRTARRERLHLAHARRPLPRLAGTHGKIPPRPPSFINLKNCL